MKLFKSCCASLGILLLGFTAASATTVYWDINGATAGAGGATPSGTWSTATANWSTDSTGASATQNWIGNDDAVFSAGSDATSGFSVTLSGTVNANSVTIEEGAVQFHTGTLTLTGAGGIFDVATGASASFTGTPTLSGTVGLTKNGGGSLNLGSSEAYSGDTTINGGTVIMTGTGGALGVTTNSTITLDGGTLSNASASVGAQFFQDTRTLAIGAAGGTIDIPMAAAILFYRAGNITGPGNTVTKTGAGTFRLSNTGGSPTHTTTDFAKLVVTGGLWQGGQDSTFGAVPGAPTSDAITLSSGGGISNNAGGVTLHANRGITLGTGGGVINALSGSLTIAGAITGTGSLTKTGASTLTLNNTGNNYSGATLITAGSLLLGASGVIPDGSAVDTTGGTLNLNSFSETIGSLAGSGGATLSTGTTLTTGGNNASTTYSGVASGEGALTKAGTGILRLTGANTYSGGTTISAGELNIGNGTTTGSTSSTALITNNGTLRYNRSDTAAVTQSGVIDGTGQIIKEGNHRLNLTGANTFTGGFTLNSGGLSLGNNAGMGPTGSAVTIAGGTLSSNGTTTRTPNHAFKITGDFTLGSTALVGNVNMAGTVDLFGATRQITTDNLAPNLDTISAVISNSLGTPAGITKAGAGKLAITNTANTYDGPTTITAGILEVSANSILGNGAGTLVLAGGGLNTTASRTVAVANPISLTANTDITTTSNAAAPIFNFSSNTVGGTGGTLTFRNDGADAGTDVFKPRFSGNGFNFAQPITLATGANSSLTELNFFNGASTTQTFSGVISGSGSLNRNSSSPGSGAGGTTILSGANDYSGGTILQDGQIGFGSSSTSPTVGPIGAGTLTVAFNNTGVFADTASQTVSNAVVLNANLNVTGSQALELSGTVSLGATAVDVARTLNVTNSASTTLSGVISNGGSFKGGLTKAGAGTLAATAVNTYTGDTSITEGTLSINEPYLDDAADVYLTSGTMFDLNFADNTIIDTIDSLFFDGVSQAIGTWGTTGSGAANIDDARFSGLGRLLVQTFVPSGGVPGDYNENDVVDAADYVMWRMVKDTGGSLQNEIDTTSGIGVTDDDDYDAWRGVFGNITGASAASNLGANQPVPEPATVVMLLLGLAAAAMTGRRR